MGETADGTGLMGKPPDNDKNNPKTTKDVDMTDSSSRRIEKGAKEGRTRTQRPTRDSSSTRSKSVDKVPASPSSTRKAKHTKNSPEKKLMLKLKDKDRNERKVKKEALNMDTLYTAAQETAGGIIGIGLQSLFGTKDTPLEIPGEVSVAKKKENEIVEVLEEDVVMESEATQTPTKTPKPTTTGTPQDQADAILKSIIRDSFSPSQEDKETTPVKNNGKENTDSPNRATGRNVLWSSAVQGSDKGKIQTHEKMKYKYEMNAEVTFDVGRNCDGICPSIEAAILRETLINVLKRGKHVDAKFALNAYHPQAQVPTIKKPEDITINGMILRSYISHVQVPPRRIRQGRNSGFRVNMTFSIEPDEFIHLWDASKRDFTKVPFVSIKKTPMQNSPTYNTAGFLVNTSEKQCTKQLEQMLSDELQIPIGLAHRSAAVAKNTQDALWKKAKETAAGNPREIFKNAPLAQQVYAPTKELARKAAEKLYAKYGRQTNDGQYPRFPDGTRMRFVPATHFLDMKSRTMANSLLQQQILFQQNTIRAPIPVTDPYQRFESQGNKTMQELILDLQCEQKNNEPYFRHIAKKWTREYNNTSFEVEIHGNMFNDAARILRKLPEVLEETYGKEVAEALIPTMDQEDEYFSHSQTMSIITLDTEDRYMNGCAQFIFTGMDKVEEATKPTQLNLPEERSMNIKSTTSGLTGHYTAGPAVSITQDLQGPQLKQDDTNDPPWEQVGTEEDRTKLAQQIAQQAQNPGAAERGQHP